MSDSDRVGLGLNNLAPSHCVVAHGVARILQINRVKAFLDQV